MNHLCTLAQLSRKTSEEKLEAALHTFSNTDNISRLALTWLKRFFLEVHSYVKINTNPAYFIKKLTILLKKQDYILKRVFGFKIHHVFA